MYPTLYCMQKIIIMKPVFLWSIVNPSVIYYQANVCVIWLSVEVQVVS